MIRAWLILPILFSLFQVSAQEAPLSYHALLNLELPEDPKAKEQEIWQKRFDEYMAGIRKEIGFVGSAMANARDRSTLDRVEAYNRLHHCVNSIGLASGGLLDKVQTVIDECDRTYQELTVTYQDALNKLGNNMPSDFLKRVEREQEQAVKTLTHHDHPDRAVVLDDFTAIDQVEFQLDASNPILSPKDTLLANEVVSILVNLYQSDSVDEVVASEEENEVMLEVVRLGQMVSVIKNDPELCRIDLTQEDDSPYLSHAQTILFQGHVLHDKEPKTAMSAFFALPPEQLKRIQAYRFNEGDRETWLFRDGRGGLEEIWVMAEYDPASQALSYRHFKIREAKQEKLIKKETINLLPQFAGGVAKNKSHVLFETDLGLKLEADRQDLPILGNVAIPSGRIVLGSARLRTFGLHNGTDTRVDLDVERVSLSSGLYRNNNVWNVSAITYYKTLENKWHTGVQARVYNIFGGYAQNSKKEFEYHLGLVVKQNYAKVQVTQDRTSFTVGRQFRKNRGGAAVNTNFKDLTQFRLYIFL